MSEEHFQIKYQIANFPILTNLPTLSVLHKAQSSSKEYWIFALVWYYRAPLLKSNTLQAFIDGKSNIQRVKADSYT